MLIDDLRADAHAKKGRLFWVGCDTRKGDMADGFSSEELDAEFLSILDSAVVYDCAPLMPMLTQQTRASRFALFAIASARCRHFRLQPLIKRLAAIRR